MRSLVQTIGQVLAGLMCRLMLSPLPKKAVGYVVHFSFISDILALA